MKKLLFMLFSALCVATVLVSCSSDDNDTSLGGMRINGVVASRAADVAHLSAMEIAQQSISINYISDERHAWGNISLEDFMRDTTPEHPALVLPSKVVLREYGEQRVLNEEPINVHDAVVVRSLKINENGDTTIVMPTEAWWQSDCTIDTIAYIPNKIMREAYKNIKAAWDAKDYDAIKKLFHDAIVYYPTTAKEWHALKAKGDN